MCRTYNSFLSQAFLSVHYKTVLDVQVNMRPSSSQQCLEPGPQKPWTFNIIAYDIYISLGIKSMSFWQHSEP